MVTKNGDLLARQARERGAPLRAPRGRRRGKYSKQWLALRAKPFDPANYLQTEEDSLYYLEAAMEGNDPKHIASALGDVARSKSRPKGDFK